MSDPYWIDIYWLLLLPQLPRLFFCEDYFILLHSASGLEVLQRVSRLFDLVKHEIKRTEKIKKENMWPPGISLHKNTSSKKSIFLGEFNTEYVIMSLITLI